MRRVTPGWVRLSRVEAATIDPVSTTARKASTSRVFMMRSHNDYQIISIEA